MHGGKTATSTSTYHGDDNEDHVDLNYDDDDHDDDGDDDGYDDDDDRSVFEAASRISPVHENSSDDYYGPYWDNSQLAHHIWIMCQINCQTFSIFLFFLKKILFLFKK